MYDVKPYTEEAPSAGYWRYEKAPAGMKVDLLTKGGISVNGTWKGELGEYYIAWAPLRKRNHSLEKQLFPNLV